MNLITRDRDLQAQQSRALSELEKSQPRMGSTAATSQADWWGHNGAGTEENAQDEPVRIGKKEQERLLQEKRDRKGARTAKTGSKANKANAKERDDAKERTNKKNGLLH